MKIVLLVKVSDKTGKNYKVLACKKGQNYIYLTFDQMAILRVTGMSVDELDALPVGEYPVEVK